MYVIFITIFFSTFDISFISDTWLEQIQKHQSKLIPYQAVEDNKVWFEYLFNPNEPSMSRYRCRLCFKFYDKFNLEKRYKNALAMKEGILKQDKSDNKEIISKHSKIPGHQMILERLQRIDSKR